MTVQLAGPSWNYAGPIAREKINMVWKMVILNWCFCT